MEPSLSLSGVDVAIAGRRVLSNVNATFPCGGEGVNVLLGPNGSGKTTMLRAILGLIPIERGEITLGGESIRSLPASNRSRRFAYVPQRTISELEFAVEEVVSMGRFAAGETASHRGVPVEAVEALEAVGLQAVRHAPYASLSAGQQQRVNIARALAQLGLPRADASRSVLLADEPTAWLDPAQALHVMSLLGEIAGKGTCVVVVIHDLTQAMRFGRWGVVLDSAGKVATEGTVGALLSSRELERVYGVAMDAPRPDDVIVVPRRLSDAKDRALD